MKILSYVLNRIKAKLQERVNSQKIFKLSSKIVELVDTKTSQSIGMRFYEMHRDSKESEFRSMTFTPKNGESFFFKKQISFFGAKYTLVLGYEDVLEVVQSHNSNHVDYKLLTNDKRVLKLIEDSGISI